MPAPSIATVDDMMLRFFRELRRDAVPPIFTSPSSCPFGLSDLRAGTLVEFSSESAAVNMLRGGWSNPEGHHTWNDGKYACMEIPVYPDRPTVLHFKLFPFRPPGADPQEVQIFASGHKIAVWTVAESGEYSMVVPSPPEGAATALLDWCFPRASSPRGLGLNTDPRFLAIALRSVRLHPL